MTLQTANMAAPDLAEEAGDHRVERCQTVDDAAAEVEGSLSGVISRPDGAA